jgi:hypothetical protein
VAARPTRWLSMFVMGSFLFYNSDQLFIPTLSFSGSGILRKYFPAIMDVCQKS